MGIIEVQEGSFSFSVDNISSNVVLSSDFLNSISEKQMLAISDAVRHLAIAKEKPLNPVKFHPYFVGFEVDHIEISPLNYPNDRELKVYMSSGFLFYSGIFYIPEIIIPITLKYRIQNPSIQNRTAQPFVYVENEEINLYFSINKILDAYKEPRDIFDGKNFIKSMVNSAITFEVKINDSSVSTLDQTIQNKQFYGSVQFGKVTRTAILKISSDFNSYNRKITTSENIKKNDRQLKNYLETETSKTKLDYYKKFQVGDIYKLNHLKKELETPDFPFIAGDTPLSLVDKEKTPDFYEYLNNYKLPFAIEIDGFHRNAFPKNSSGKCVLTLFFNLNKLNNVILNNKDIVEYLQGNLIPYLFSMLPMHPVRTVGMENYRLKGYNDHHFGTNNKTNKFLYNSNNGVPDLLSLTTLGKKGNYASFGTNLHSDSMPEKAKGIVIIPRKISNDNKSGTPITIVGNVIKRSKEIITDEIFDTSKNADNGLDFYRKYFMTAFNGTTKAIDLYRDESIESDPSKATHIGVTIDDFCYMSKNAISMSFLYSNNNSPTKLILEFYPYKIPQMPSFEFIPANLPWAKGVSKPVNSKDASSQNSSEDGGWCEVDKYTLTGEYSPGTNNSNVWYCNGYNGVAKLLNQIKDLGLKYMVPEVYANESQEVFSNNRSTKKIIYTGHSGVDGNNKPSIMIPNSSGVLQETKIENTILDMQLRHSKKSGGVWNFVYPRIICPLYFTQTTYDGSNFNISPYNIYYGIDKEGNVRPVDSTTDSAGYVEDSWKVLSVFRPAFFIWMNDVGSSILEVVNSIISSSLRFSRVYDSAGGLFYWEIISQTKTIPPRNTYGYRYYGNWGGNRSTGEDNVFNYFTWFTAYIYNVLRIAFEGYGFGIFNGLFNLDTAKNPHVSFRIPYVQFSEYMGLYTNETIFYSSENIRNKYYRDSNVQLPIAWVDEYNRGKSDMYIYPTGLFLEKSLVANLFNSQINNGFFQYIESVMDLKKNSVMSETANGFVNRITPSEITSDKCYITNPIYPIYAFGGSVDNYGGGLLYVVSMGTDTLPISNSNEHTFLFPLINTNVTSKVSGRYPFPTDLGGYTTYLQNEWKPYTLKSNLPANKSTRDEHYVEFTKTLQNSSNPISETVGFRWSYADNLTEEYFRYYSLMVIEEFKKNNDLSSLYFIGFDLEKIVNPETRYAVWYPNRNSFGAKGIDDCIVDIIKNIISPLIIDGYYSASVAGLDNLNNIVYGNSSSSITKKVPSDEKTTSPIEILDSHSKKISPKKTNGYDGSILEESNVTGLISSGGIALNNSGELSTSFLEALNIWGIDYSIVLYNPSEFFIKKQGGNDWILSLPNYVQLFNSPGTSISGSNIIENYSAKIKENTVRKDQNTTRFAMFPYGKKDGFSYIYIGKIL